MKQNRRDFLKLTGMAGFGLAGTGILQACASDLDSGRELNKVIVDYAVAKLGDGSIVKIPFWRIDSGKDGPSLLLIAAQHGNEVQGTEVTRRFKEVCARKLTAGSAWLLPMANLPAVHIKRHSINLGPEQSINYARFEGHNMNLIWPGDPEGNDTARVTYALDQAVVRHCSHGVDIHCWEHFYAPETLSVSDHEPSRAMGKVTTTRFLRHGSARPRQDSFVLIAQLIRERGGAATVIELSGQYQIQERQVQIGLSSMVNTAKLLGMIEGEPKLIEGPRPELSPETSHEIHAPCSGIFMPAAGKDKTSSLRPEDHVEEGQLLGHIINESNLETVPIFAPVTGYLWQYGLCHWKLCDVSLPAQHPYAGEGEALARVVTV